MSDKSPISPTPTPAHMTPVELLALYRHSISGDPVTDAERETARAILSAACFGIEAYHRHVGCGGGASIALLSAFLTALIDPLSPDLDYLRIDPASGPAARSGGAA